jgi:hypothetical protein
MQLELDDAEFDTVTTALESRLAELTRELARTEKISLQHELALMVSRLEAVTRRIEAARRATA